MALDDARDMLVRLPNGSPDFAEAALCTLVGAPMRTGSPVHLVMEYRGYSRSAGSPSREALVEDARSFLARVLSDPRVDGSRLVFHGRSLGGGVAVELASHHAPRALVLPYAHVEQLASAARSGRLITYEADHNDCPPDFGAYLSDVLLFLSEVGVMESASLP